jgi:adenosine deaminase
MGTITYAEGESLQVVLLLPDLAMHACARQVVGFDMVDDESKPERRPAKHMKTPREWDLKHNPAYAYYAFYTYANLFTLNKLREARGLNTFALRPHAGTHACARAGHLLLHACMHAFMHFLFTG